MNRCWIGGVFIFCTALILWSSCSKKFDCVADEIDLIGEWELVKETFYEDEAFVRDTTYANAFVEWDCDSVRFMNQTELVKYAFTLADIETEGSRNYFQSNFLGNYTSTVNVNGNTAFLTIHMSGDVVTTSISELRR